MRAERTVHNKKVMPREINIETAVPKVDVVVTIRLIPIIQKADDETI